MPKITRDYVFKNGKKANANEVNAEIDKIHALVNGKLDAENLAERSIEKSKIAFLLASDKFRGSAEDYNDLATSFPDARHGDVAIVSSPTSGGEMSMYMFNTNRLLWEKIAGTVQTPSHNSLTGRNIADAHPMSSITGLVDLLEEMSEKDLLQDERLQDHTTDIAGLDTRMGSLEADNSILLQKMEETESTVQGFDDQKANNSVMSNSNLEYRMGLTQDGAFRVYYIKEETGEEINVFTVDAGGFQFGQAIGATSPTGYPEFKLASNELQLLKPDGSGGNLLLQGDFGIGGNAIDLGSSGYNISDITEGGVYSGSNLTGVPSGVHNTGTVLHLCYRTSNYAVQHYWTNTGAREYWIRRKVANVYEPWQKVITSEESSMGGKSIEITGTNIDNIEKSGWYSGHSLEGGPPGVRAVAYVEHINYFQDGYALQKYFTATGAMGNEEHWVRVKNGGDWRPWRKIPLT